MLDERETRLGLGLLAARARDIARVENFDRAVI